MRRWAKAQSDFASDFVRHVSTTKLRELAGVEIAGSAPSSPIRTPQAPKVLSAPITQLNASAPTESQSSKTRRMKSRSDNDKFTLSSESQDDSTEDEDNKAKRIQTIQTKLTYYRRKVNDLEEELNLLLGNPQKGPLQNIPITSSGDSFPNEFINIKTPLPPQLLADLHERTASDSDLQNRVSLISPTSPTRPSSSRPSDRQILNRSKLSIDRAWTIDPSQVQIDKQLGGLYKSFFFLSIFAFYSCHEIC